eukprot:6179876-Pleurochrysis_carterae.AAC.11
MTRPAVWKSPDRTHAFAFEMASRRAALNDSYVSLRFCGATVSLVSTFRIFRTFWILWLGLGSA